jgi:hypothetical protein
VEYNNIYKGKNMDIISLLNQNSIAFWILIVLIVLYIVSIKDFLLYGVLWVILLAFPYHGKPIFEPVSKVITSLPYIEKLYKVVEESL